MYVIHVTMCITCISVQKYIFTITLVHIKKYCNVQYHSYAMLQLLKPFFQLIVVDYYISTIPIVIGLFCLISGMWRVLLVLSC